MFGTVQRRLPKGRLHFPRLTNVGTNGRVVQTARLRVTVAVDGIRCPEQCKEELDNLCHWGCFFFVLISIELPQTPNHNP